MAEVEKDLIRFADKDIVYNPKDPKYELTKETTMSPSGVLLYRIKALKDFQEVKAGQLGGFVQSYDNLNLYDDSWIDYNSCVYGMAYITDNSYVCYSNVCTAGATRFYAIGNAFLYKCNIVNCMILNPYEININYDPLYTRTHRYFSYYFIGTRMNNCKFEDSLESIVLFGSRNINNCKLVDDGEKYTCIDIDLENIDIPAGSFVVLKDDLVQFTGFGSRYDRTTVAYSTGYQPIVKCGCFHGDIEAFRLQVQSTLDSDYWTDLDKNNHNAEYLMIADLAEHHMLSKEAIARREDLKNNKATISFDDISIPLIYDQTGLSGYDLHDAINNQMLSLIGKDGNLK